MTARVTARYAAALWAVGSAVQALQGHTAVAMTSLAATLTFAAIALVGRDADR